MRNRLSLTASLACVLLVVGCQASIGEKLYDADRAVSLTARGVTDYAKSGAIIAPKTKTALIDAASTADATLDAAHLAYDTANKAGATPGVDAVALADAAKKFALIADNLIATLKGTHAHH